MSNEKIKIQHAEAWVDTMPIQPTPGGTLHVHVELISNNHGRHFLVKKVPQGINPSILLLEIKISPLDIFIYNPQNLTYTEGLSNPKQFNEIEIFSAGKQVAKIVKIPIIK